MDINLEIETIVKKRVFSCNSYAHIML